MKIGSTGYRNSMSAYRRFARRSFLDESHELLVQMIRHRVTAGIVGLMLAAGFAGWLLTYLA